MTNEQIENEAASYVGDILGLDYIGKVEAERAFKAGASWRINSVWHDKKEIPERGRKLALLFSLRGKTGLSTDVFSERDKWYSFVLYNHYEQWAYLDDLLPDGKEGGK